MDNEKVRLFLALAGQKEALKPSSGNDAQRKLGAQLLLSEVLEYVIKGLGVTPVVNGTKITDPEAVHYEVEAGNDCHLVEMVDGLSDVAYTMYWNQLTFGLPLEEAFDIVCDNNLTKFVKLNGMSWHEGELPKDEWHCGQAVSWPAEVARVEVLKVKGDFYAIGKDARGKVRKPSTYRSVELDSVVNQ